MGRDEAILAHIREGQLVAEQAKRCFQDALQLLITAHQDAVFSFFTHHLPGLTREEVEDLTQEVFLAAYQGMSNFRMEASIRTWFWRITRNKFVDEVRKKKPEPPLAASNVTASHQERWEVLLPYLRRLPLDERLIIALRFHGALTASEIAEVLGIQRASLRQKYGRAIKHLRGIMEDDENP